MTDIQDDTTAGPAPTPAEERRTTEGSVFTVTGGDWDTLIDEDHDDRIVINMGPQHPSTHGVLRLVLELEGETVHQARSVIGYLHTGIEKNCEYRTWTQGVTFVTRMDYLAPLFSEAGYCMGVEKLLGIEVPRRAQVARVLLMELNRISSHLVCLATGGMELGALTGMTAGFREREEVLHLLEFLTGLRMNHAYIRPGGLSQDFPEGWAEKVTDLIKVMRSRLPDYDKLLTGQPIWRQRLEKVGYLPLDGCLALGATGPILRAAGLPWDLRKVEPYSGYEEYDFEVPTATEADCYARYRLRVAEMHESLKIVEQAVQKMEPGPVMVAAALDRFRRHGQHTRARPQDHGSVDGVADPPLQAGHRGLPRARGPGVLGNRVAPRRARLPPGLRRRHAPGARPRARTQLREPADDAGDERGRHGRRRHRVHRQHRPGDGRGGPMTDIFDEVTRQRSKEIIAQYPQSRSALLPLLHLVQSVEGFVSPDGIRFCADELELTTAEVSGVATFYTMYKRTPCGEHIVSVCTNTLCAVLGGDDIYTRLEARLGVGHEETAGEPGSTGSITLEHAECLAACDLAPVLQVNYEFYDNQSVESAETLVDALQRGEKPHPTRGAPLTDFKTVELELAGIFPDLVHSVEGPSTAPETMRGAALASERGWLAPAMPDSAPAFPELPEKK